MWLEDKKKEKGFALAAGPLAAGLLVFGCLCLVPFFYISAEMCAGLLIFGRLFSGHLFFISLLKGATFNTQNCNFGDGYGYFWCPEPVIWQAWCFHFGFLGEHGVIQGHLGAHKRTSWDQGLDFYRFWMDFGTPF